MRITIIFIFSLVCLTPRANSIDYCIIDSIVKFTELPENITISELSKVISKEFKTKNEKICAIYCWIAQNIEYDWVAYRNKSLNYLSDSSLILETYSQRKGVCSGYSHLFKYLLDQIKINSIIIDGYARNDIETINLNETNHAWNAIEINKEWFLFDVTWARDTLNKKTDFFWFKTKPELFIASHYPSDNKWTLLQKQITLKTFLSFPIITHKYFDLGFNESFPSKGSIEGTLGKNIRIYFRPNFECLVLPRFYNLLTGQKEDVEHKTAKDNSYIDYKFTKKGNYAVPYSILIQDDEGIVIYSDVLIFNINIK